MLIDMNTTTLATIGRPLRDLLAGISGVELKVLQDDKQRRGLHIGDARSDPDAHACREGNHERRLPSTIRSMSASTGPSTLTTARRIRISIVPAGDTGFVSCARGSTGNDATTSVGVSLTNTTGMSPAD
jgi:hypothetical protein